jgi:hypothetical protein
MTKSDWKKIYFYQRMLALEKCGFTYEGAADQYRDNWDKLSPYVREQLEKVKVDGLTWPKV